MKQLHPDLQTHPDLFEAQNRAYTPCGFFIRECVSEKESQEYGACDFEMNGRRFKFRVAKITPTKIGQFVTLWKRVGNGPIMPYDMQDPVEVVVVSVRDENYFGQFVFPKRVLLQKGVFSKEGKGGKRAIRVYPPWDIAENPQAKTTQKWQLQYFFPIEAESSLDPVRMKQLFFN